jgi:two-component system alkaline phosphatase synthesis response regulator PhoP
MAKGLIFAVDDEDSILNLVEYNLRRDGFDVESFKTGEQFLVRLKNKQPDLIILDLMLPGIDGLDVCKLLKKDTLLAKIPVIMLTAKSEETDIITGLEIGADDYVVKPFSPRILIARIKTVLREKGRSDHKKTITDVLRLHNLVIHPGRHEVKIGETKVKLTYTEFGLLHLLARKPGWVYSRYQIVDALHGEDYPVTERAIDVQIVGLRKKLGRAGKYVETVRGVGYRFREEA